MGQVQPSGETRLQIDPASVAPRVRWRDLVDRYISDRRRVGYSSQFLREFRGVLASLIRHTRARSPGDVSLELAEDWLILMSQVGRKGRPLGPKTVNNFASMARGFYGWMQERDLVTANPFSKIHPVRRVKKRSRVLDPGEVSALVAAAQDAESDPSCRYGRNRAGEVVFRSSLYAFLYVTGMRIGSAESLRVRNFDPKRGSILISGEFVKNGEPIELPLGGWLADSLSARTAGLAQHQHLFIRPRAETLRSDAKRAGISVRDGMGRGIGFHTFRHSSATHIAAAQFNASVVQRRLGHLDIRTTLNIYTHAEQSAGWGVQCEVSERLEANLRQGLKQHAENKAQQGLDTGSGGCHNEGVDSVTLKSQTSQPAPRRTESTAPVAGRAALCAGERQSAGRSGGLVSDLGAGVKSSSTRMGATGLEPVGATRGVPVVAAPGRDSLDFERLRTVNRLLDLIQIPGRSAAPRHEEPSDAEQTSCCELRPRTPDARDVPGCRT